MCRVGCVTMDGDVSWIDLHFATVSFRWAQSWHFPRGDGEMRAIQALRDTVIDVA